MFEPAVQIATEPSRTPDWSAIGETIRCPLCGYDLRGLPQPRCPECGRTFEWADLLDPASRRHPYLFEQHHRAARDPGRALADAVERADAVRHDERDDTVHPSVLTASP
jgi:hypothetical protein